MNKRREPEDFSPNLLEDALDAVRADDAATEVPERLRHTVMRAYDQRPRQRERKYATPFWFGAVAAGVIAAVVLSRTGVVPMADLPWSGAGTLPDERVDGSMLFTEVALADDRASMQYVQVRVPQSALADFGLPIADPADHQPVVVEVLVGLDGVPRAVRLLSQEMP